MTHPLSLAYLTVDGVGPVEHIRAAQAGGFEAAGLRILSPSHVRGVADAVGNPALLREIKRACAASGVRVFDVEVITLAPQTEIARYAAMLDAAAEIGARYVQTVCEDADLVRAGDRFAALCEAAAGYGLAVALEFMQFRAVRNVRDAAAIVGRAARDNAGVLVDALHLSRSGGTPDDVRALPPGQIAYLQLCDGAAESPPPDQLAPEARTSRLHPGEGALPLAALLAAAPRDRPYSVEVPNRVDAPCSADERARRAGDAARRFLAAMGTRG